MVYAVNILLSVTVHFQFLLLLSLAVTSKPQAALRRALQHPVAFLKSLYIVTSWDSLLL